MTPEQTAKLLELLSKIADALSVPKVYTLTGAADWPLLIVVSGIIALMIAMIGGLIKYMWVDLRIGLRDNKVEWKAVITELKQEEKEEHDLLWSAIRDCQSDCCPPRIGHADHGVQRRKPGRESYEPS